MKKAIRKIKKSDEAAGNVEFWGTRTPEERISAVQVLREQYITLFQKEREYRESRKGLRRVCSAAKRSER